MEDLGLLQGVIVTGQGHRGGFQDPGKVLLTRRVTARLLGTGTGFPMRGSDLPLLSTKILVTTTGPSLHHVTDSETIFEKITSLIQGGHGPLSPGTGRLTTMIKPRLTPPDPGDPCHQDRPQGGEGRGRHHRDSEETGPGHSVSLEGHGPQDPPTLQMAIMSNTIHLREMASNHRHQLLPRKMSRRIFSMLLATFLTETFLMTPTTMLISRR